MKVQNSHKYDDIIHLPHPVSKYHPQMPPMNRAAQFMPFAALTGHDEAIQETARRTDSFIWLDEDRKEQLNQRLLYLLENQEQQPECEITCFQPDGKKEGGAYVAVRGRIKKIDARAQQILFTDGTALPMEFLFSIEGELFQKPEDP